jgi:hypothetical protein
VESFRVTEMSLDGGNPMMLDRLNAGVVWQANPIYQRPFDGTIWTNLDINGSGAYNTEIMTDGQTRGRAINLTLKSETNSLHGDAYECSLSLSPKSIRSQ